MRIDTRDFGAIEIQEEDIIYFPEGVYGFEQERRFALLDIGSDAGLMHLQCVDHAVPRLIVADPFAIVEDYAPQMPQEAMKKLRADAMDQLSILSVMVVPQNIQAATINLKSPIAINFKERLGLQVILNNRGYQARFPLFPNERTA